VEECLRFDLSFSIILNIREEELIKGMIKFLNSNCNCNITFPFVVTTPPINVVRIVYPEWKPEPSKMSLLEFINTKIPRQSLSDLIKEKEEKKDKESATIDRKKNIDILGNTIELQINNSSYNINIIIPLFEKYPLIAFNKVDFIYFKIAGKLMKNREHLTTEEYYFLIDLELLLSKHLK